MSHIIDFIDKVIVDKLIDSKHLTLGGNKLLQLKEDNKSAKCKLVSINVQDYKFVVVKPDKIHNKKQIYNSLHFVETNGLRSICDSIVFFEDNSHLKILIANMKSDNEGNSNKQILSGLILASNIVSNLFRVIDNEKKSIYEQCLNKIQSKELRITAVLFMNKTKKRGTNFSGHPTTNLRVNFLGKNIALKVYVKSCGTPHAESRIPYSNI